MSGWGDAGGDSSGLGKPSNDRPDFAGPDFAGPDYAPPSSSDQPTLYGQRASNDRPLGEPPPAESRHDAGGGYRPPATSQSRPGGPPLVPMLIAAVMVLALIATVVVLVNRSDDTTEPPTPTATTTSRAPSPSPTIETRPAGDALGLLLASTGLTCIQVTDDPVINDCETKPSKSYVSIRWIDSGPMSEMAGFRMYAKAKSASDRRNLNERIGQLKAGGLSSSDESKIIKTLAKAKKVKKTIDAHTAWGEVTVDHVEQIDAFQLTGTKSGAGSLHYAGDDFGGNEKAIVKKLAAREFTCHPDSYALTCTKDSASMIFYSSVGKGSYNYLDVTSRSRATDEAVSDLLPLLLGSDAEAIESMISSNLDRPFYLGAYRGRLVQFSPDYFTIECVTW